jgi:hypothetical protein
LSSPSRKLQIRCHVVVRTERSLRKVPRAAVRIDTCVSGFTQRSVHVAPIRRRCRPVDSRTHQRMTKNDLWRHFQQSIGFTRGRGGLLDSEALSGTPDENRIARRLGSRDQE